MNEKFVKRLGFIRSRVVIECPFKRSKPKLTEPGIHLNLNIAALQNRFGGHLRAFQIRAESVIKVNVFQFLRNLFSLFHAFRVKRNIRPALQALFIIPVRFAMAHEINFHDSEALA